MKCFVISLGFANDRRQSILQQCADIGLSFEFWPAVDGKEIPNEAFEGLDTSVRDRYALPQLERGELGCALSHYGLLCHLIENRIPMAAVFEDDARLHEDLPTVLELLEGKVDKFDIVKLQRRRLETRFIPLYDLCSPYRLGRLGHPKYTDAGTDGYVITMQAARELLKKFPQPNHVIDWILPRFWENGLKMVYYIDPPVVFHDESLPSYMVGYRKDGSIRRRRNLPETLKRLKQLFRDSVVRRRAFLKLRQLDRKLDPHKF